MSNRRQSTSRRGALYGITAAVLFGMSAPISKLLLPQVGFLILASLLYLGAGVGLTVAGMIRRETRESRLRSTDALPLAAIVITGGVLGPILLLYGLQSVTGTAGSLLLNLEAPFTMLLAVVAFREHMSRGEIIASVLIVFGAIVLGYERGELRAEVPGPLAIAGACLCWGVDNNLTQKLSIRDPVAIVRVKTLGAGVCTMAIALMAGQRLPAAPAIVSSLVLGLFSYGVSILLDAYALRQLGAAREAAFFATAPFAGAILAIPLLHEPLTSLRTAGFLLMIAGVTVLLRARHSHFHTHAPMQHEHVHVHDEHHQHEHSPDDPAGEPHSHEHRHEPMSHEHPHTSDIHHRHRHE